MGINQGLGSAGAGEAARCCNVGLGINMSIQAIARCRGRLTPLNSPLLLYSAAATCAKPGACCWLSHRPFSEMLSSGDLRSDCSQRDTTDGFLNVCDFLLCAVGPCALEYTKMKTADHFWTDPSADELVQRHRIHSSHCRQDSPTKRPALCVSGGPARLGGTAPGSAPPGAHRQHSPGFGAPSV